jgi:hypothetical protein
MRITNLHVHNFRSICDLEMQCESLVILLGANNHGKSNIISAVEFALSTSVKLAHADFCAFCGDDKTLWVELTFNNLTEQERNTFRRYVQTDGSICIRKIGRITENDTIEVSYHGYVEEPVDEWLKGDNVRELTGRDQLAATPLAALVPATGRLTQANIQEAQTRYISEHMNELRFEVSLESGQLLGQKNVAGGVLPDFYLIPAVKDLADETKIKSTTSFGRLLNRAVREMAEHDPRFRELREELGRLVSALNRTEAGGDRPAQLVSLEDNLRSELSHWGVNVEIEVIPPVIEKIFELGTNLHLDDGVRTLAEQKGHGLQRAVIFALVRAWANSLREPVDNEGEVTARASSESVVFAMEEPELFLHPHAQRRLARAIREISEVSNHQVLISSHSTHFLDLDKYKNICIVSKSTPEEGTKIRQCTQELFAGPSAQDSKQRFHMAHWINPERGELFFAKRVGFVEGETECTLFPYLAEKMGCYDEEITIVDCGAKHNLPLYIAIANAFKIRYVVVHDEDPLPDPIPDEWNEEKRREKRRTFELNQEIQGAVCPEHGQVAILSPDFEGVSGVSRTQGKFKGKALAALEYFKGKEIHEIPEPLQNVIRALYSNG